MEQVLMWQVISTTADGNKVISYWHTFEMACAIAARCRASNPRIRTRPHITKVRIG
jgi:hypothetical protein